MILSLLSLLLLGAAPQEPTSPADSAASQAEVPEPESQAGPTPVFPREVEMVTVDVVVTDEDGRPVTGLTREDFAELRAYLKKLKLPFASVFVLTPLPGTDLYEEKKGELLTRDGELFDFFHTVLPTRLPLEEFYEELYQTWRAPVSLRSLISLARNFRLWDLPGAAKRTRRMLSRLRKAHQDH